ncbi:MarR family transcriptional regulator [Nonomuraea sp. SMC257]|uniref:MarR family transcriptional regulator n=2 Tax=Nonomuraea montanisoli TaxID=2741721 RepID=A0A7Y6I562_9ACTN|nr:MarR family transcriptional regulator [Nonomuraea montanisoli]
MVGLEAPVTMRDLAAGLSCEPSNVTGIIDALERRGLVTRQPDPADRRVKRLVLTEEGVRRREALCSRTHTQAASLFAPLGGDRLVLRDLLRRVLLDSAS